MNFQFMKKHSEEFDVGKMARIFGVSRSGYYDFLERKPSKRNLENQRLIKRINEIHTKSRRNYGSPKIHMDLKKEGESCSRKRVAKLMNKNGIRSKTRKKWKITTQPSKQAVTIAPNHLDQKFTVAEPNTVWASDITYVETEEGWLYVSVVMDLFSRKIVGLSMGDRLHTDLITQSLNQAVFQRGLKGNLMHHSDRGCQYTSMEFRELTEKHGIKLSMSAKGRCYDNAVAESFFRTLKTEEVYHRKYKSREEAKNSIFEYIEVFYNRMRLHSTLGYMSPEEFENLWKERFKKTG